MEILQQLVRTALGDSALGVAAFEAQVHTEFVICSSGINVHKHRQHVVAAALMVPDLNFVESLRQMFNAKFALVIWLRRGDFGLPLPLLDRRQRIVQAHLGVVVYVNPYPDWYWFADRSNPSPNRPNWVFVSHCLLLDDRDSEADEE